MIRPVPVIFEKYLRVTRVLFVTLESVLDGPDSPGRGGEYGAKKG